MIIGGLKQRMRGKSEEELAELFEGTPEMSVDSAVHFYDKVGLLLTILLTFLTLQNKLTAITPILANFC